MNSKFWEWIEFVIRLALGFLFIYAAIDKIIQPEKFAVVIYNYRVLPFEFVNIVAIIVPWLEVAIGITLILGIWLETAAFLLSVLSIGFIMLIISAIARGLNIECGCFTLSESGSLVSWKRVIEDILILAGGLFIFFRHLPEKQSAK
ncbi:MAG: DoxX family membrane protein [Candidatus Marinimicrobia bacterium]|nr:DoxX family membrane protein [Candidatus Neomarinimicrobiota bacterium]MCK9482971.1 DoxX family membrane protein [Candidatus Neomarinimicrobiota bacterium]MCK9558906.1 DoxX family membrane protein [Candidatus Neomarinimicrobiota bacterium]MDD5540217.1 DoxX family membrane protein [Candidatus Neomarinimicrobiota bacterium]